MQPQDLIFLPSPRRGPYNPIVNVAEKVRHASVVRAGGGLGNLCWLYRQLRKLWATGLIGLLALFSGWADAGEPLAPTLPQPGSEAQSQLLAWPAISREQRPWTYWWWMGSAVDTTNLTRELKRYHAAGLGGVHIIPIYGARGWEDKFIQYLSPKWMQMLGFTVAEAHRLDMGVDMTTGTGWCFGGPHVTDADANALVVVKTFAVGAGDKLQGRLDPKTTQALIAFAPGGQCQDLTARIRPDGTVGWTAPGPSWRVYAVSQRPSGQRVKRAAPGGHGWMLNLIYPTAMRDYLRWFDAAFAHYTGPKPRAMYHDSYEYRSDWAPDFFAEFESRRGYRLQTELPALFANRAARPELNPLVTDMDHIARVKSDYRQTISDIMAEESLPLWVKWCHAHGFITRDEAHGSPGNWLDLYADADIPETEMFYKDRSKLISKFASSAAHVAGHRLASSETGTWLKEHFTETLADMKYLVDDFFLSGINHIIYHGTCYSPDEAGWPGWHFYASYEMNPRNSIWHDVRALNLYVARCQSVLQSGRPDNDLLVYWPIFDVWHNAKGLVQPLTIHAGNWFNDQPIGKTAQRLWNRGFAFDYVSDQQLASASAFDGKVETPGAEYQAVVVPQTTYMPLGTLRRLLGLASGGATVIFEEQLPEDVPGWGHLQSRRAEFKAMLAFVHLVSVPEGQPSKGRLREAHVGAGRVFMGNLEAALAAAGVRREPMFDQPGLMCIRRAFEGGRYYFIANRSDSAAVRGWVPLAHGAKSVVLMDPLTGQTGATEVRHAGVGPAPFSATLPSITAEKVGTDPGALGQSHQPHGCEVRLDLAPGESMLLRCLDAARQIRRKWPYWEPRGAATELSGPWKLRFIQGGPELPSPCQMSALASWTSLADTNAQRFAGTARYTRVFDAPSAARAWRIDLGRVCQSARVWLNGRELGTLFTPPFSTVFDGPLKPKGNVLRVDVTNLSANRIRDLDRRGVKWKRFYDINFVNINYRPFDASDWALTDSGLLGPVTLTPIQRSQ
jgi:alpha-L-rhamnosidase